MLMSHVRENAHRLIDRLPEFQLPALVGLLETIVGPVAADLRNASIEDEDITEDLARAVAEADEWSKHNKPIPHDEVLADVGLTMVDFEGKGKSGTTRQG